MSLRQGKPFEDSRSKRNQIVTSTIGYFRSAGKTGSREVVEFSVRGEFRATLTEADG